MKNKELEISGIQRCILDMDLDSCKTLSKWLSRHIKLYETDVTKINKTLNDVGFSKRAYNVLKNNGIESIFQLNVLSSDWAKLQSLKGAGPTTAKEIRRKIFEFQNLYIFRDR